MFIKGNCKQTFEEWLRNFTKIEELLKKFEEKFKEILGKL